MRTSSRPLSAASRLASVVLVIAGAAACTTMQNAAAKDPQKCERDPTCVNKSRAADCSTQCADAPDCTDRCREMNAASGAADPR